MTDLLNESPIFIAGAGRSGTTLLRSLLSAHPRIAVTPETHFFKRAENWGGIERGAPPDFDLFWERYTAWVRFKDLDVDAARCRALIDRAGPPTFYTTFCAVLAAYGERMGKERVGEKTPDHVHNIPDLLSWFPNARILILRRDPRAVVASQMRSPWVKDRLSRNGIFVGSYLHQIAFYAEDWAKIYEKLIPAWRDDARVMVVSYETLVHDAEGELRRICAFLGEVFDPVMLTGRTNATVPVAAGTPEIEDDRWREWRWKHHEKTLRPVSTDSLDKWKEDLTETAVAMIEGRCARGMRAAGYAPVLSPQKHRMGRALVGAVLALEEREDWLRSVPEKLRRRARSIIRAAR